MVKQIRIISLLAVLFLFSTFAHAATVTRGPYLQIGTSSSIVIKWRTDVATDSRVRYGLDPAALTSFKDALTSTTEHEVQLSGLTASTKYY
jgi:hypothetical protein